MPSLVGSAFVFAAAASLTVAALDNEEPPPQRGDVKVGRITKKTPSPASAERPRNSNPESPSDNIEEPRKPSGLRFEPIDAPSLCVSDEHD